MVAEQRWKTVGRVVGPVFGVVLLAWRPQLLPMSPRAIAKRALVFWVFDAAMRQWHGYLVRTRPGSAPEPEAPTPTHRAGGPP